MGEHKETEGASLRSAELPAGRELDILVASRVMGWKDIAEHRTYECGGDPKRLYGFPPEITWSREVPWFSVSIEAAWEVVEKLVKSGCKVRVEERLSGSYCDVTGPDSGMDSARENSTPLAICRAALRAVGTSGEVPADSAISPPPPGSPRTET